MRSTNFNTILMFCTNDTNSIKALAYKSTPTTSHTYYAHTHTFTYTTAHLRTISLNKNAK